MRFLKLIPYYFAWHYSRAIKELVLIWSNYLWFSLNYFSVKVLLRSLFKPFHNVNEETSLSKIRDEFFLVTFLNSIVGFMLRITIVLAGILCWIAVLFAGIMFLLIWLVMPFVLMAIFVMGMLALGQNNI